MPKTADELAADGEAARKDGRLVMTLLPAQEWMAVSLQVPFIRSEPIPSAGREAGQEFYFAIAHPDIASDLRLTPRERWRMEHRAERMRRKGVAPPAPMIGSIEGIRFYA